MVIDITRSGRQDLIGREGYTKGATEQCRKTSIDNTRSRPQDLIGREGYTKGARVGHYRERERRRHGANYSNQSIPTLYLGYISRPRVGDAFTLCRDSSKHSEIFFSRVHHNRTCGITSEGLSNMDRLIRECRSMTELNRIIQGGLN